MLLRSRRCHISISIETHILWVWSTLQAGLSLPPDPQHRSLFSPPDCCCIFRSFTGQGPFVGCRQPSQLNLDVSLLDSFYFSPLIWRSLRLGRSMAKLRQNLCRKLEQQLKRMDNTCILPLAYIFRILPIDLWYRRMIHESEVGEWSLTLNRWWW